MSQEMHDVLRRIHELTRSARQPGQLSREQLAEEARKIAAAVQESLVKVSSGLQQQSGGPAAKPEERKQLTEQMKGLKWGFVRT